MGLKLVLRYDDFGLHKDGIEFEKKLLKLSKEYNVKITVGIVPKSRNLFVNRGMLLGDDFSYCLNKKLLEVALHGYKHKRGLVEYALRVHGEFKKKPKCLQEFEIKNGLNKLAYYNLKNITCFIPPYNQYDNNTIEALYKNNISVLSAGISNELPMNDTRIKYVPFTTGIEKWEELYKSAGDKNILAVCPFHWYNYDIVKVEKLFSYVKNGMIETISLTEAAELIDIGAKTKDYYLMTGE